MEFLFTLGISDNDLKSMLEQVPNIMNMKEIEIKEKIDILKYIDCSERCIKNIIISNPYYLDRINNDVLKLIGCLKQYGFKCINLLFDSNPYFLNYDAFEIREYIDIKLNSGMELEEIVDMIDSNPYIIDEE